MWKGIWVSYEDILDVAADLALLGSQEAMSRAPAAFQAASLLESAL
jgi:hypothetical protein